MKAIDHVGTHLSKPFQTTPFPFLMSIVHHHHSSPIAHRPSPIAPSILLPGTDCHASCALVSPISCNFTHPSPDPNFV
ncbi:hypothetical protein Csa_011528, partial [Cucumis sativus]